MDSTITVPPCQLVRSTRLSQQWVKPGAYWEFDGLPYAGAVAVKTNVGWLILVDVIQVVSGPDAGAVRYERVKADGLPVVGS